MLLMIGYPPLAVGYYHDYITVLSGKAMHRFKSHNHHSAMGWAPVDEFVQSFQRRRCNSKLCSLSQAGPHVLGPHVGRLLVAPKIMSSCKFNGMLRSWKQPIKSKIIKFHTFNHDKVMASCDSATMNAPIHSPGIPWRPGDLRQVSPTVEAAVGLSWTPGSIPSFTLT